MKEKTVFFDLDDTLYDRSGPYLAAFRQFFGGRYEDKAAQAYQAVMHRGYEVFTAAHTGKISMDAMHIYRHQIGLLDVGIRITAAQALQLQAVYAAQQQRITLSAAVRAALDAGLAPVLVTVRPDASPELLEAVSGFDARVEIVPAPDAHLGQAESLKAGIRRLVSRFDCLPPGVVVLLGDQPLVGAELVRELTAFYLQKPECAAAPACDGVRGNPVILPAGAFGETLLLSGDKGARGILAAFGLRLMPTNDTAAITDVDTWEAYESLSRAKPL